MVPLEVEGDLLLGGLCAQTVVLVLSWFGCCCLAHRGVVGVIWRVVGLAVGHSAGWGGGAVSEAR